MTNDSTSTDKSSLRPGVKHWLLQVIPPLSMAGLLLATTRGTSLVFLTGLLIIPALFSLISIIVKLFRFNKSKHRLVRPVLVVAMFFLIIHIANWSYQVALEQTVNEARIIHDQCNENLTCPEKPVGWQVDDSMIRKDDLGFWFRYTALYYYDKTGFNMRAYHGPDSGDIITGGVNLPFKIAPYSKVRN